MVTRSPFATPRSFSERGKARRKGPKTYPVGTWQLKSRHFGALKVKREPDQVDFPGSYCHFNQDWSEADFNDRLAGSAIRRIGHERWLRNIAVALGNAAPDPAIRLALETRLNHASALVREHTGWALARQTRA